MLTNCGVVVRRALPTASVVRCEWPCWPSVVQACCCLVILGVMFRHVMGNSCLTVEQVGVTWGGGGWCCMSIVGEFGVRRPCCSRVRVMGGIVAQVWVLFFGYVWSVWDSLWVLVLLGLLFGIEGPGGPLLVVVV